MVEVIIGLASLLLALTAFFFERGWLPPKYRMTNRNPYEDPITRRIVGTSNEPKRQATILVPYKIPEYKGNSYKEVRIVFGREFRWGRKCVWTGKVSDGSIQECVLMAKPSGAREKSENRLPSGQSPVYVRSTEDIPEEADSNKVRWGFEEKLRTHRPYLDSAGREWRIKDPKGDLVLMWKS